VERFITLITAAFCVWNVGLGFVAGMLGAYLHKPTRTLRRLDRPADMAYTRLRDDEPDY
jgi:hypothetical protein